MRSKHAVVDLFAGAGGFGLGFELSKHFKLNASIEVDDWACDTLIANRTSSYRVLHGDIRDYKFASTFLNDVGGRPKVLIGGPPCQGFSRAGQHVNRDPKDPRNSLFRYYAKWVAELEPEIFVMENVKGILSRKNGRGELVSEVIREAFRRLDYEVTIWSLNAAAYGVPQMRERVFFVGSKKGDVISPPVATHWLPGSPDRKSRKRYVSTWQAISDLPKLHAGEGVEERPHSRAATNEYQAMMRGANGLCLNHVAMNHTKRLVRRFEYLLDGRALDRAPQSLAVRRRSGDGDLSESIFDMNYRVLRSSGLSYTIPASFYSSFVHPKLPRNITAREAARIQSFPDSYRFMGKRTVISSSLLANEGRQGENKLSQYNQIGNAVPPQLASVIAKRLFVYLQTGA